MDPSYRVGDDVTVLASHLTVPGVGALAVNSFVIHAQEPVLVDTGMAVDGDAFLDALRDAIDPAELRWVWLTHDDSDHSGNLAAVLEAAPHAQLVTHAFSALRMAANWPVPLDRVYAIAPGDVLDAGDRVLRASRPPTYDNPMSTALFDERTRTLFSVDAFGAMLPGVVQSLDEVDDDVLVEGILVWTTFDSPWSHLSDRLLFDSNLQEVRALEPTCVLASHLPPAFGRLDQLLDIVADVPDADPFVPPGAADFREIVAALAAG
jgi:Metallo-beta-lactamase superfamily